jgi:nicotinamidase/pyrazinamidase
MSTVARRRILKLLSAGGALALAGPLPAAISAARAAALRPGADSALIVVDVQNCFVSGGTLPVKEGEQVVPVLNAVARRFANVVITQDWHTAGHASFASSHPGSKPFESIALRYGQQVLWPDHCVQGTADAALHPDLDIPHAQLVLRKGFHQDVDSYSAFKEADRRTDTGLAGYLFSRGIRTVYLGGLATDFCVAWTALDARAAGFRVLVIEDACRAIDLNGSLQKAWQQMTKRGVRRIKAADII